MQKDNSTCVDHSLLLLASVITNNSNNLDLYKLGVVIVSNNHGNHANLFIISPNPDLQSIIESNIASYKTSLGLNDIDYSHIILSTTDSELSQKFHHDDTVVLTSLVGDNPEIHLFYE